MGIEWATSIHLLTFSVVRIEILTMHVRKFSIYIHSGGNVKVEDG